MNGVWPIGRGRAACGSALLSLVLASACAHGAAKPVVVPGAAERAELTRLSAQLAERDQTIVQLEGRMAMLETSEQQLREQLERARAEEAQVRETVRIGAAARGKQPPAAPEPRPEPRLVLGNNAGSSLSLGSESRPLLRLHAERGGERSSSARTSGGYDRELTSSAWTPPTTTERLTIAQVPALPTLASPARAPAAEPRLAAPANTVPVSAAVASPSLVTSGPADELYVHALDLLRRRELPEALRELAAFLRGFPGDPRVARAQFWRGEILYAQRDFAGALAAFEQSLVRDPSGDKAPDTLLRIVRCQQRLGAHERARAALNKLRTQFPDSEAARVAAQLTQEDT
jgi:tol-pal system protein YbgF